MALVPHRHNRSNLFGEQVSKGTASRHGVATIASASQAETIAKQPPGPRLTNNWLQNPTFNQDARYPAASQSPHSRSKNSYNGRGAGNANNKPPVHWARYCPLYTSSDPNDYFTILNNYFLRNRKKDDTYLDIAAENSTGTVSDGGYLIGPTQDRILGLYGTSNHLNSRNNNPDRNYSDIPVYGATTGNINSETTFANGTGWIKNSYYQIIQNIPATATTAKFGAYVQVLASDDFEGKNYASIRVSQDYYDPAGNVYAAGHTRVVYGMEHQIFKTSGIPSTAINSSDASYVNYNWNGPSKDNPTSAENPGVTWPYLRWPSTIQTQASGAVPTSDYRDFKLVERTYNLQARTGTYATQLSSLLFELCFFEHSANIVTATGNSTPSGSVRFYAPYVQFYDSSNNVIAP